MPKQDQKDYYRMAEFAGRFKLDSVLGRDRQDAVQEMALAAWIGDSVREHSGLPAVGHSGWRYRYAATRLRLWRGFRYRRRHIDAAVPSIDDRQLLVKIGTYTPRMEFATMELFRYLGRLAGIDDNTIQMMRVWVECDCNSVVAAKFYRCVPAGTVASRMHRAVRKIRDTVSKELVIEALGGCCG